VAFTESKTMLTPLPLDHVTSPSQGANIVVQNNEHLGKRIHVKIPGNAQRGTYVVDVTVLCVKPTPGVGSPCPAGEYDGYIHKLYLKVQ